MEAPLPPVAYPVQGQAPFSKPLYHWVNKIMCCGGEKRRSNGAPPQRPVTALTITIMYQSNRSLNIPPLPPGIPWAFNVFCCPVGREFDELSLPRGGAFDHYAQGAGNLIARFDVMLRRADSMWHDESWQKQALTHLKRKILIRGGWLKSKGLHKLCSEFEGIQEPFVLSSACKSVVY